MGSLATETADVREASKGQHLESGFDSGAAPLALPLSCPAKAGHPFFWNAVPAGSLDTQQKCTVD